MILYAPMFRAANKVIFGCEYQKKLWIKRYRLNKSACSYIHNGIDVSKFVLTDKNVMTVDLRQDLGLVADDFIVGMVANFWSVKRHSELVAAVARLNEEGLSVKIIFVGDGPLMKSVKEEVQSSGIGNQTHFLGQMQDVRPALAAMDVFALTSKSETFSNAALEAMAMGRPVVLSDVGGAREMVSDGVNGYLYASGDVDGLVNVLKKLITSPGERLEMGQAARAIAEKRFSFQKMVSRYEALLAPPEY